MVPGFSVRKSHVVIVGVTFDGHTWRRRTPADACRGGETMFLSAGCRPMGKKSSSIQTRFCSFVRRAFCAKRLR